MAENQTSDTKIAKILLPAPSESSSTQSSTSVERQDLDVIQNILQQDIVSLECLNKMNWQGLNCPLTRAQIWRLILGHENSDKQIRSEELKLKRLDYIENLNSLDNSSRRTKSIKKFLEPILKYDLFQKEAVQISLTKLILLISGKENLKKKYISSIIIPFYLVFLSEFYPLDLKTLDIHDEGPQKSYLSIVEADTYCCSLIFLSSFSRSTNLKLSKNIIKALERFDSTIFLHITEEVQELSIFNRWIKHLFLKDFPLHICVRIFDELISIKGSVGHCEESSLHISFLVCLACALLSIFRNRILLTSGPQLKNTLSKLPTENWGEIEILILISQAYLYQSILE